MFWARIEWLYDQQPSLERLIEQTASDPVLAIVLGGGTALLALIALFGPRKQDDDPFRAKPHRPPVEPRKSSRPRRRKSGPLTPLPQSTYNIVVADLENDPAGEVTDRLVATLAAAFEDVSDSLPVTVSAARQVLPFGGDVTSTGELTDTLRRHHAALIVDGRADVQRQMVQLNSMSATGHAAARGTWKVPFDTQRSIILAAELATAAVEARAGRRDVSRLLDPVAERLKWLIATNPPVLDDMDHSRLLLAQGHIWEVIGGASGLVSAHRKAHASYLRHNIDFPTENGIPATSQRKALLGRGRSALALAEATGIEADGQDAVAAFRLATGNDEGSVGEEIERAAKSGLAEALAFTGVMTGDSNRLGEGVAAARDTLKTWPHHIDSAARARLVGTLGQALVALGSATGASQTRDEGIVRLREAADYFRSQGNLYRAVAIDSEIERAIGVPKTPAAPSQPKSELPPLPPAAEPPATSGPMPEDPQLVKSRRLDSLDGFIARHREALRGLSGERDTAQWAQVQYQLADAMAERADMLGDQSGLHQAWQAMRKAQAAAVEQGAVYLTARADDSLSRIARTAAFHGFKLDADDVRSDVSPTAPPAIAPDEATADDRVDAPIDNADTTGQADEIELTDNVEASPATSTPALQEDNFPHDAIESLAETDADKITPNARPSDVTDNALSTAQEPTTTPSVADDVPTEIRAVPLAVESADAVEPAADDTNETPSTEDMPSEAPSAAEQTIAKTQADEETPASELPSAVTANASDTELLSGGNAALSERLDSALFEINRLVESGAVYRAALARDARDRSLRSLRLKDGALDSNLADPVSSQSKGDTTPSSRAGEPSATDAPTSETTDSVSASVPLPLTPRALLEATASGKSETQADDASSGDQNEIWSDQDRQAVMALRSGRKALDAVSSETDPTTRAALSVRSLPMVADALRLAAVPGLSPQLTSDLRAFVESTVAKSDLLSSPYVSALANDVYMRLPGGEGSANDHEG